MLLYSAWQQVWSGFCRLPQQVVPIKPSTAVPVDGRRFTNRPDRSGLPGGSSFTCKGHPPGLNRWVPLQYRPAPR